eukprot:CAMPEP_0170172604 /NCGR_PEP_ID=MMETSP0040_2-20121228/5851_1 /TAXON_ID=641309 /ORGANISM="Lotharella oceanica, Strain CCMP622" /LENGTH=174 /DNA_ID=CAMNT_0010413349 /DNA_START=81 /DNA_END=605 /DNA_ORIENTATION=-
MERCIETKQKLDPQMLARFDCRVGSYATAEEAMSLVMWRGYDCGVNGVSDAVHKAKDAMKQIDGKIMPRKKAVLLDTGKKLGWLNDVGLLPLPKHQACGSYFVREKKMKTAFNPQLNKEVECLRSVIEKVDGNVLELARDGKLLPTMYRKAAPSLGSAAAELGDAKAAAGATPA